MLQIHKLNERDIMARRNRNRNIPNLILSGEQNKRRLECPKGYQMINGNCQQAVGQPELSYIDYGDVDEQTRLDCSAACESIHPAGCHSGGNCNCSCCTNYHYEYETLVGQYVITNDDGSTEVHDQYNTQVYSGCHCAGCYQQYSQCINRCLGGGGSKEAQYGGSRDWRQGGKITSRRRGGKIRRRR